MPSAELSVKPAFQKNLTRLHTWSGLSAGLLVAFLGLTGAGFVLRPHLDGMVYGRLLRVPACYHRLPLDTLVANAVAAYPAGRVVHSIEIRASATDSTAIQFADEEKVYLNPCTGVVLGRQNEYGGFFGFLDGLHRFRFMAGGRQFAGTANAFCLGLLLIGGLILWWPRGRQSLRSAATFNRRLPGPARTINLHKVVGLYSCLVLLVLSLTGLPIAFQPVKHLIGWTVGSPMEIPPPPKSRYRPGAKRVPMQRLWERCQQAYPGAEWVTIHNPIGRRGSVWMELLEKGARHTEAKSYLYLDAYSGQVLRKTPYATAVPLGRKIYTYLLALHSGLVGGLPYQLLLLVACLAMPVQLYSGASPYLRRKLRKPSRATLTLRLTRRRVEAADICTFELSDPKGRDLPPFSAGSHINVHVLPGLIRSYSLCNDPRETHRYLIGVLRVPDSRGGSRAMHEALQEGALVEVGMPSNHFPLEHSARRHLLLAGGIGITPILSMAERLAAMGADFQMHYCTRSLGRSAFRERIRGSTFARRVSFHFDDGPPDQRFDPASILAHPDADTHLYVCGPGGFMDAVITTARSSGWQEENIHREYFKGGTQSPALNVPFDLKVASTGHIVRVPAEKSALEALREAGVELQSSCTQGVCGTCMTRVLAGEPDHRDLYLTAEERARNDRFLPCCSRSAGGMLIVDL
jgi:vanillate O-demethylase ferredoxin subunit